MSTNRNVNGRQFNQGEMFTPLKTIIDEYDKADSPYAPGGPGSQMSPRDQWESPYGGPLGKSLREMKLRDKSRLRKGMTYEKMLQGEETKSDPRFISDYGPPKPPVVHHRFGQGRPELMDGHHRIAHLQEQGHTEIAVEEAGLGRDKDFYNPRRPWRYR